MDEKKGLSYDDMTRIQRYELWFCQKIVKIEMWI